MEVSGWWMGRHHQHRAGTVFGYECTLQSRAKLPPQSQMCVTASAIAEVSHCLRNRAKLLPQSRMCLTASAIEQNCLRNRGCVSLPPQSSITASADADAMDIGTTKSLPAIADATFADADATELTGGYGNGSDYGKTCTTSSDEEEHTREE